MLYTTAVRAQNVHRPPGAGERRDFVSERGEANGSVRMKTDGGTTADKHSTEVGTCTLGYAVLVRRGAVVSFDFHQSADFVMLREASSSSGSERPVHVPGTHFR